MNLRNYSGEYSIGLDMGTGSVGWAVTDEHGKLLHFKKRPTWGSRLFDSAQPASEARVHRGQRRRYIRRRWRLDLLQKLFELEMNEVDSDFFKRLNMSRLVEGDPIFNGDSFTKDDYYKRFPTIYHLRAYLIETDEKADLRLVYLALHNIVKHRGNFLREGEKLSAESAKPADALKAFGEAFIAWCETREYVCNCKGKDLTAFAEALANGRLSRSEKAKAIADGLSIQTEDAAQDKKIAKNLANAMLGLKCEFKDVFGEFACETTKIALSEDENLEALQAACPDDCVALLEALCGVYAAYVLQGLLSYAEGQTISYNMIAKYECYAKDLKVLKALVREFAPKSYETFFRGDTYHDDNPQDASHDYSRAKAQGYTAYDLHKTSYDDFAKEVKKLFVGTAAEQDERYIQMMNAFAEQRFLRRLKTSDNGAIYYQLHLEELRAIIKNQGRFYPFLKQEAKKLESLVTFRIPYYVGPLTSKNARKDVHGGNRFQWSERKSGMEEAVITPWNWDQVIDKNKSAENFILRMTGDCTYLAGEKVLPKCSLLYEEFCVLNELNGVRFSEDGDDWHRLDAAQREGIVRELFHNKRRVSYKDIAEWLVREGDVSKMPEVHGGQGESGLESKMDSYRFFVKDIFRVQELSPSDFKVIEQIILWNTLFEDRGILKEKLEDEFGPSGNGMLDATQIKAICKKRFTGWGRLSGKFLTGIKVTSQTGYSVSIMDVLREGNPNATRRQGETMVLMEVLHDKTLGFEERIEECNREYYAVKGRDLGVNELPGSPAIRRSLNQAIRIVDEIAGIAGHAPANVFIEVTRDDDERKKGKRTTKRWDRIEEALKNLKSECAVLADFKELRSAGVDLDERLTLYFVQNGKCLYSGRPINLEKLLAGSGEYEVDHIIPRAYIKDDSLENKALVYREENQRKTDQLLLDKSVRWKMRETWAALHSAKLIGDKKFNNLMRSEIKSGALKGFIARQLVETSQMVKLAQALLAVRYPETKIVPVKASMSHNLREAAEFIKCREANDYHHAHDAYLACRIGLFIQMRHPDIYDNPIGYEHVIRKYVSVQAEEFRKTHRMPGSAGFVINSFMKSGFDKETGEIFRDTWNAEAELEGMRRSLNYRQCYISRMPQEDTGAFWNATVYSPRDPKMGPKLALATKQGLDPKQFGGFSSQQFAYFFIYEAQKKGKPCFQFAEVPVWLASRVGAHPEALTEYARGLAQENKLEFVRIVRPKILKKQLIELDGERFVITGKKAMANSCEIAFNIYECSALERRVRQRAGKSYADISRYSSIDELLDRFENILLNRNTHSRLFKQISMDALIAEIRKQDEFDALETILRILLLVNGSAGMVDLTAVGGSKFAGYLQPNYSKLLNDPNTSFYIIDQSVTGMFERKTRVGL